MTPTPCKFSTTCNLQEMREYLFSCMYGASFSLKVLFCLADCHFCKIQKQKQWKNNTLSLHYCFFFCLRTWFRHNNRVFILRENRNEKTQPANTFSSIGSLFLLIIPMVSQWVINGHRVLIILNENGPINGTEMLLTVHHFLSKLKKWK